MKYMSQIWFGLGCFLLGLAFLGDLYLYAAVFSLPCFGMVWFTRKYAGLKSQNVNPKWSGDDGKTTFVKEIKPDVNSEGLSTKENRRKNLASLEENIDRTLLDILSVLKQAVPANTLAIFFPDGNNGMYLRVWITQSDFIMPGANIKAGQGLTGLLLKEGVRRILELDISTSSTQLYYYSADEKIRSVAGVPIIVEGVRRGAVIIDSRKQKNFSNDTISILENFASVAGRFLFYAYVNFENACQKDQLLALTQYQRKFFGKMAEDEIIKYVVEYIEQSVEVDRIMIASREKENQNMAAILFCKGLDERKFQNFEFGLDEHGLLGLVFEKKQIINRSFSKSERIPRLSEREPFNDSIRCMLAVPVQTDKGISHVLSVESSRKRWFTEHEKGLLMTIARASGFAISRARLYKEKEQMARKDGLTGLINHKTFQEQYKKELLRAQREDYPLTVLMLDIDFFKSVNDKFGHPVGDMVLKGVARIIEPIVRAGSDTIARYGGEEFVCLLINSDYHTSRDTAERIRQAIEKKEFDIGKPEKLKITVSIGGALFPNDSSYGEQILDKADKSLYHAKENGRNRVVFFSEK